MDQQIKDKAYEDAVAIVKARLQGVTDELNGNGAHYIPEYIQAVYDKLVEIYTDIAKPE